MSVPVISVAQMREWEKVTWAKGNSESAVIRNVGLAVAKCASRMTQAGDSILVLAGKGHNGDDARAAAEFLPDRRVQVLQVAAPSASLPQLEQALGTEPALVVDGLFGVGLNRRLSDDWIAFIERLNLARMCVLAVDVPSGLNADTGENFGSAVAASLTLTVAAPKVGLLKPPALPFVGKLEVATNVGLNGATPSSQLSWILPEDFSGFPPRRAAAAHKGNFGHLTIIAGSLGYHGAAVLATRGAQRAQPGLITVTTPEASFFPIASQLQAAMVKVWNDAFKPPPRCSAALVGPGLAATDVPEELKTFTKRLWRDYDLPVIVDASALDWLPSQPIPKNAIRVMTPHPGEAARLLGCSVAQIQADRVAALRKLSQRFGQCWVVLKGHQTLVGRSEGCVLINSSGNPHLAQGGSGDVLAGYVSGLLAQPDLQSDIAQTLAYAVWQHGAAADVLQEKCRNWTVEDLAATIGDVGQTNPRATAD